MLPLCAYKQTLSNKNQLPTMIHNDYNRSTLAYGEVL
jgi:hypothetical protein